MRSFAFWCIALVITIPFCLLENSSEPMGLDKDHLRQNGYSEAEINAINSDFNRLNVALRSRGERLMPSQNQDQNSLQGLDSLLTQIERIK